MSYPSDLLYSKDHEWVRLEGTTATVGITAYAAGELGDIVYVEVETIGETLEEGETFGTVEAVKTVSDLFMPLTGEVTEFNDALEADPEVVNKDPYVQGWMVKLKVAADVDTSKLMDSATYMAEIGAEA